MEATGGGWLPAAVFLAVGLAVGLVVVLRVVRGGRQAKPLPEPGPDAELLDLRGELEALVGQLRELDETPDTGGRAAAERRALELEAARTLLELERGERRREGRGSEVRRARAPEPARTASPLAGFLWGIGVTATVGGLLFLASRQAEQRPTGPGTTAAAPSGGAEAEDAELQGLRAAAARSPEDVEARLDLARGLLERNDLMTVFEETQVALRLSPGHPRALAYQAVVRLAMGQAGMAEGMLKEALAKAPGLLDAHLHLLLLYAETGREKDADAALKAAVARFPDRAEDLRALLARMRADARGRGEPPPPPGENPHAAMGPGAAPATGAAATGRGVSGTIDIDPSVARPGPGAVVFVLLRVAGATSGPPLAVGRVSAASFPVPFEVSEGHSTSGGGVPEAVLVEARLDEDGDAGTRSPGDPVARVDGVELGSREVHLVLGRRP